MTKKEQLINQVKNFENKYFNEDQKTIAINILERSPEQEVQAIADFIFMKRRTGFAFDYSPEIAKGRLITLREDKKRRINVNDKIENDENKLIIGDNYNALKALELTHKRKIDVIYIDPPYNTEAAKSDGNQSSKEGKSSKFLYKDKFGRGGWLNMMKSRLKLAKKLLVQSGVIFISIDDSEQAYLKVLMDSIFGEDNTDVIIWKKVIAGLSGGGIMKSTKTIRKDHEYILLAFQNKKRATFKKYMLKPKFKNTYTNPDNDPRGPYKAGGLSQNMNMTINKNSEKFYKLKSPTGKIWERKWRYTKDIMNELIQDNRVYFGKNGNSVPAQKIFINEPRPTTASSIFENLSSAGEANHYLTKIIGVHNFNTTKPLSLIERILEISTDLNSTVLDFFAGSGTTGEAVINLNKKDKGNRKFILSTNNENNIATSITYERIKNIANSNKVRVINIDDCVTVSLDKIIDNTIYKNCIEGLKLLNFKYNKKGLNLYYDLAAFNPIKNDEDKC